MDFLRSALDYAEGNAGRFAAIVAVIAPALHLNLTNGEANTLAEIVLFLVFVFEEAGKLIERSVYSAPKPAAPIATK